MFKLLLALLCLSPSLGLQAQGFTGCATGRESVSTYNADFDRKVLELVNAERAKRKLPALQWRDDLANAARYHAQDMAMEDYMEHDSYDRNKSGLKRVCGTFDRINKFVKGIFPCAENIAAGSDTPQEVVADWMSSSGHKANILNKKAKYLGCGCYNNDESEYGLYWVQCFGY